MQNFQPLTSVGLAALRSLQLRPSWSLENIDPFIYTILVGFVHSTNLVYVKYPADLNVYPTDLNVYPT